MSETPSTNTPVVVARLKITVDKQSASDAARDTAALVGGRVSSAVASAASSAAASARSGATAGGQAASRASGGVGMGGAAPTPQSGTGGATAGGQAAADNARQSRNWWQTMALRIAAAGGGPGRGVARMMLSATRVEDFLRERASAHGGIPGRVAAMIPSGAGAAGIAALATAVAVGAGIALARWTTSHLSKMLDLARNSPAMAQVALNAEFRERRREFIQGNRLAPTARYLNSGVQFFKDQWAEAVSFWDLIFNAIGGTLAWIGGAVLKIANYINPMHWFSPGGDDVNAIYRTYWNDITNQGRANPVPIPGRVPAASPRPGGPGGRGPWSPISPRA